jgi:hypothetical protein
MTAVNFFVVIGAALTQQIMGQVMSRCCASDSVQVAGSFHSAFVIPVAGLGLAWSAYLFCRDTKPH